MAVLAVILQIAGATTRAAPMEDGPFPNEGDGDLALPHGGVLVTFSADGRWMLTAGATVQLWDTSTFTPVTKEIKHRGRLAAASFDGRGSASLLTIVGRTVFVVNAATTEPLSPPLAHDDIVATATWTGDRLRILTTCHGGIGTIWEAKSGRKLTEIRPAGSRIGDASFDADGQRFLTLPANSDGAARVWDAATGQALTPPLKIWQRHLVGAGAFSPDGRVVATAELGDDGLAVALWEVATGNRLVHGMSTSPTAESDAVAGIAFDSDGTRLAVVTQAGWVTLWDTTTGQALMPPLDGTGEKFFVGDDEFPIRFTRDGRLVFAADCVWDVSTGHRVADFRSAWGVPDAAFSLDGSLVAWANRMDGRTNVHRLKIAERNP